MSTPQERIGEKLVGTAVDKTLEGAFKIIESIDKKVDMLLQAFIDSSLLPPPPRRPGT